MKHKLKIQLLTFLCCHFLLIANAANDTLVNSNTNWKYLDNGSNQGTAWTSNTFNDASWFSGNGEFGYGDGDENTIIFFGPSSANKFITTYFRKSFTVSNSSNYNGLLVRLLRDDGAVVYLNGVEVTRSNMPSGSIAFNTLASSAINNGGETKYNDFAISPALLVNGTNYLAVEIHQNTPSSNDISFNLQLIAIQTCDAPVTFSSTSITTTSATVNWNSNTVVQNYTLQYRVLGTTKWKSKQATPNTFQLTGLNAGTTYEWRVKSNCSLGTSAYSAIQSFTTLVNCQPPTNCTTTAITATSATLNWNPFANAINYNIVYRKIGTTPWDSVTTTATSVTLTSLSENTGYEWKVRCLCINNTSISSAKFSFTTLLACSEPTLLIVDNVTPQSVSLNCDTVTNAISYTFQYKPLTSFTYNTITSVTPTINVTGLLPGTDYVFHVRSNCILGYQSNYSSDNIFSTPDLCGVPTGLTILSSDLTTANIAWDAVAGALSYGVAYKPTNSLTWIVVNTTDNNIVLTNLIPNADYSCRIKAYCPWDGNYSAENIFSTTSQCNTVTNLSVTDITENSVQLTWDANNFATDYNLRYKKNDSIDWIVATTTTNSLLLSDLLSGTQYQWQVSVNCSYNTSSDYVAGNDFTTLNAICNPPSNLSFTNISQTTADVSWDAVAGAVSYELGYRLSGNNNWTFINTTNNFYNITGLTPAALYEWQVRTNCATGNHSTYVSGSNFSTLTPDCNTPISLQVANITPTTADLSWTASASVLNYDIRYRVIGDTTWNAAISNTNAYQFTSLIPITDYECKVRANCTYGNQSAYAAPVTFTTATPGPCSTVTGLTVGTVTTTTAVVSWTTVPGAFNYTVHYRKIGLTTWSTVTTAATTTTLNSLTPSTTFEVQVATNCNGASSTNTASVDFTTTATSTILTRGPYLQMVTPTSINIRWRSSTATNSLVRYGTDMSVSASVTEPTSLTEHEVSITNLTPGTKYFYTIGSTTVDYQGNADNYFYTALPTGSTAPFRIWSTGDFGNNSAGQSNTRNAMETYTAGNRPGIWIWQGDNAYTSGTDLEYTNNVFNIYPNQFKNIPVYPCLGNHDYGQNGYLSAYSLGTSAPYFSIFSCPTNAQAGGVASNTEKYYSYNYGNVHFIVLDSYGSLNAVGSPQYNWLQSDLAANTQRFTIAMFHHAPYSHGTHNSDTEVEMVDMRNNFTPLFDQYKVDLVLNGHSHNYERTWLIKNHQGVASTFTNANKVDSTSGLSPYYLKSSATTFDGTVYCVIGVSGQGGSVSTLGTWPHNAMVSYSKTLWGSLIIDVNGDTLDSKFLTSTGTIYDRFKIVKSGAARIGNSSLITGTKGNEVEVFPNPFSDELNVRFMLAEESTVTIEAYDLLGKKVYSSGDKIKGIQPSGTYEFVMDQTDLKDAHGMLIIKVYANGKVMQTKVEKVN